MFPRRRTRGYRKQFRRRFRGQHAADFEPLESRLALATAALPRPAFTATISFDAGAATGGTDAVLELVDTGDPFLTLQLRDGSKTLGSHVLDQHVQVIFKGASTPFSDSLTINLDYTDKDGNANTFLPFVIQVSFDGGLDVPLITDDRVVIQSTGMSRYRTAGLFLTSTDDVTIGGGLDSAGDIDIQSAEVITVNAGAALVARDIRLAAVATGVPSLPLPGGKNDVESKAAAAVSLTGAALTGRNISIDAGGTVALTSKDKEFFGGDLRIGGVVVTNASTVAIEGATAITASGTVAIDAAATTSTNLQSTPDSTATNPDLDAAVAVAIVSSGAAVRIGGTSTITAAAAVSITANNTVTSLTHADGTGNATTAGVVVAILALSGETMAEVADTATIRGAGVSVVATSDRTVDTKAVATPVGTTNNKTANNSATQNLPASGAATSSGAITVAGAFAWSTVSGDTRTIVSSGGGLDAGAGSLVLGAVAGLRGPTNGRSTVADASTVRSSKNTDVVGVGVAVSTTEAVGVVTIAGTPTPRTVAVSATSAFVSPESARIATT
ncbi:MAG: hypothetical protein ACKOWG_05315, partial [Planctomycetia bacterium]